MSHRTRMRLPLPSPHAPPPVPRPFLLRPAHPADADALAQLMFAA